MKITYLLGSAGLVAVTLAASPIATAVAAPGHSSTAAAAPAAATSPLSHAGSTAVTRRPASAAHLPAPVRLPAASAPVARGRIDSRDPAVSYRQEGSTVTARRHGSVVTRITLRSLTRNGSSGRLALTVTSVRPFTLHTADLVWEDQQGGEIAPLDANRVLYVGGHSAGVEVDYRGVTAGAVVWVPGNDVAGVWGVA